MFIAHIPAGYLCTKLIQKKYSQVKGLYIGILGSIFPDLDMFVFYFIDKKQFNHHLYATHIPFFYILIWMILNLIVKLKKWNQYSFLLHLFFINSLFHLLLDSFVGGILWLYPWSHNFFYLFTVKNMYSLWQLNFILHPTFLFEIIILCFAINLYIKKPK